MRFPSIPTFVRTFSFYNFISIRTLPASYKGIQSPFLRNATLRSMPTIPFLSGLFSQEKDMTDYPVKQDQVYQAELTKEQLKVIRGSTEAPYLGSYDKHMPSEGVYKCAGCDADLYRANHKFKSGCGWPAYFDSIPGAVKRITDRSMGLNRIEIVCSNCGGHLGHIFKGENYPTPTNERHCVNSISMTFDGPGGREADPQLPKYLQSKGGNVKE